MAPRYLRHYWSDNAGVTRTKVEINGGVKSSGVGLALADQAQCMSHRSVPMGSGIGSVGDIRLIPDRETFVEVPHLKNTYRVIGDMFRNGTPWDLCPRNYLKEAVLRAAQNGFTIRAAFEPEFYLLKLVEGKYQPIDNGLYGDAGTLSGISEWIDTNVISLEGQNVFPEIFHHESGPGQYEMSLRHADPIKAADDFLIARDTIKSISKQLGITATFCPKPLKEEIGNGLHLNISIWKQDVSNVPSVHCDQKLSANALHFLSGVINNFDAVIALTCPSSNSYKRLQSSSWSGASKHWDYEDRSAAIRIPRSGISPITHMEFRAIDATANPYLALGGIINLGIAGLVGKHEPLDAGVVFGKLSSFNESMKKLEGSLLHTKSIDSNLFTAYQAVRNSNLFTAYQAVRKSDYAYCKKLPTSQEEKLFIERY